jgi:hypothetical protein
MKDHGKWGVSGQPMLFDRTLVSEDKKVYAELEVDLVRRKN